MLPDRVSNPGPLTYESGALPIALRGPCSVCIHIQQALSIKNVFRSIFPLTVDELDRLS